MKKIVYTLLFFVMSLPFSIGQRTVTGKVLLEGEGEAIGASVAVDGDETIGTVTEFDGTFSLDVPAGTRALKINYTGYISQTVSIENTSHVAVTLALDGEIIQECVVVGYGTSRKGRKKVRIRGVGSIRNSPRNQWADPIGIEQYAKNNPNKFVSTKKEKTSTFSIDVDNASYSNARRFLLQENRLPPKDAIRIEEMVNYFDYDYPIPQSSTPFSINTDLAECPWNKENQLLRIGLQGYKMELAQAPVNNLVFLIDVSGSMSDDLYLIKESLNLLVDGMRDEDRIGIVVYASREGLVLPSTPGTQKDKIKLAINLLESGGSTAGGAGIELAYKIAKEQFMENENNRIILCTDGDFNVGISSTNDLEKLIVSKRDEGISLTVLGFGMGNYKDEQLETLADKGNGNYGYIDNIREARKMLVDEVGSTMFTIAKDVKIQIEFDPAQVKSYRLIGYENRLLDNEDFDDDSKDAGELGAGHSVTALYEIIPNKKQVESIDLANVKLRYKRPQEKRSQLLEQGIPNKTLAVDDMGADFSFAAAVAAWGMLLRDSPHKGEADFHLVRQLAQAGIDKEHTDEYREEFLQLLELSEEYERKLTAEK